MKKIIAQIINFPTIISTNNIKELAVSITRNIKTPP